MAEEVWGLFLKHRPFSTSPLWPSPQLERLPEMGGTRGRSAVLASGLIAAGLVLAAQWCGLGAWRASGAPSGSLAFEAAGMIEFTRLRNDVAGGRIMECAWFSATSDGHHWLIRFGPLTNQAWTYDYVEAAFDSINLYLVSSLRSWVENQKALGRTVGKNRAVGMVSKRPVPDSATYHQLAPLWLAYGSAGYFQALTSDTIHCPAFRGAKALREFTALEDYRVKVRVVPGPGGVPTIVSFLETNGPPPGGPFWWPAGVLWTNAVFAVQQFTNIGPFTVPVEASLKVYAPYRARGASQPEMLEWHVYSVQAGTIRLVSPPRSWRPELPELTHVGDLRFMGDKRRPVPAFGYLVQGKWYTEAEVKRLPEYRKAAGLAPARATGVTAVRLLVLAALVSGPLLYYLVRKHWMPSR